MEIQYLCYNMKGYITFSRFRRDIFHIGRRKYKKPKSKFVCVSLFIFFVEFIHDYTNFICV